MKLKKIIESHLESLALEGGIDTPEARDAVSGSLATILSPILALLAQSRQYLDGSKDPEVEIEGVVASQVDAALKSLVGDEYKPPTRVLGRKHLRPTSSDGPDFSWENMSVEIREVLSEAQKKNDAAEIAYGFVWRSREVLWFAPLKFVPLRRVPGPLDGLDFLVGRREEFLPLLRIEPTSVSSHLNIEFSNRLEGKAKEQVEADLRAIG